MPGFPKSGRSTCKGCNKLIEQGALRIGKLVPSPHFDGEVPMWHHRSCLFKREVIADASLIQGLGDLRPEDQKSLKDEINKGNGGGSSSSASAATVAAVIPLSASSDKYKAEYAKSNRSTCKHCKDKIENSELRIGKMVEAPNFDGLIPAWHHFKCVWKACVIFATGAIEGYEGLRPEDQKEIKKMIEKHGLGGGAAATDADGDADMEDADTKKSTKSGAGKKKAAGKKRGRKDSDEESEENSEDEDVKPKKATKKAAAVDFSKLSVAELKEKCEEAGLSKTGKKGDLVARLEEHAAAAAPAADADEKKPSSSAPAADPERAKHDKILEKEASDKWKVKDAIASLSNQDLKDLLAVNNQPNSGGRDKLIDAVVDGLMYGQMPACEQCGHHALTFNAGEGMYVCHGAASEWAKCQNKLADVKRKKFDVSCFEGDCDYFNKYTSKPTSKPVESYLFIANANKKILSAHAELVAKKEEQLAERKKELAINRIKEELFNDFTFCFIGKKFPPTTHTAKQLETLVEEHGGELTTDIEEADIIIIAQDEVKNNKNKKMKEAIAEKKPILIASYITDTIEKSELRDPADYSALNSDDAADQWTDLKSKVESGRQKSGAALAAVASGAAIGSGQSSKSGVGKSGGGKAKVIVKGRAAVDTDSGLDESGHVLDEGGDNLWTQTLNITDLSTGVNSYYILQLIESDRRDMYYVFRKWGRTGTDRGSTKLSEHYGSKDGAKKEFQEVYLDKTGNIWSNRKNFQKKPGKFFPIAVSYENDDDLLKDDNDGESTSKLDKRIQDIIKIFFDVKQIKQTLLSMDIDLSKMPLGKMSKAHIQSGYDVLTELQNAMKVQPPDSNSLLALSNKFYTLIPHAGNPAMIQTEAVLKEKIEMVETLLEIEVATRMLKESKAKKEEATSSAASEESNDPIDIHYRQLKTDMTALEHSSSDFKMINNYMLTTHAATHKNYTLELLDAFEIDRHNEAERYKPFSTNSNRKLLWHGSRTTNFVGILSQGLRIAPPEAPVTGYMFGKGVYFADMSSKSANYCFTNSNNNVGFLMLCEVALGDMNLLTHAQYMDKAPGKCLSTKGVGMTLPDPKGDLVLPNGCVVPTGKPSKLEGSSSLLYNEFIVYDVAQINCKYLLKVKFNYSQRW